MIRLVKMTFQEKEIEHFKELFSSRREQIAGFPGCNGVKLWQDREDPRILFTYSQWQSEKDLEHYRQSDLFKNTWSATKKLFADKPEAWSVDDTQL